MIFFLSQCAQINPLQGGAKDMYAPKIDTSYSYPKNGTTNFQDNYIELKFSEFIKLNKPTENIIITPQMSTNPDVQIKNKKLKLIFQEPLKENTTYTINFNGAVTDITEQNDSIFQVVFSTGDFIDSNAVSGIVRTSETNRPAANYLVGLYPVTDTLQFDSIPYKSRPYYITQTNEKGRFDMQYLKGGDYYIFAFDDKNRNLIRDQDENLAFEEKQISIGKDSSIIRLRSFKSAVSTVSLKSTSFEYPGKVTTVFTGEPKDVQILDKTNTISLQKDLSSTSDSLIYWLSKNPVSGMSFIITYDDQRDTIKPLYKGNRESRKQEGINQTNNLVQNKLLPMDTLKITFSQPIQSWEAEGIQFLDADSVRMNDLEVFQIGLRTLSFPNITSDIKHIKIDSAALKSFYNQTNQSIIWTSFDQLDSTYFGSLILNVDSINIESGIIELLDKENNVVQIKPLTDQIIFEKLPPGDYQVRLIIDKNKDGEWTTGSLADKRQPEKIIYNKELINIKSKWEKEVDWIIQNE